MNFKALAPREPDGSRKRILHVYQMRLVAEALMGARDTLAATEPEAAALPAVLRQWRERLDREAREALDVYVRALSEWTKGAALVKQAAREAHRRAARRGLVAIAPSVSTEGYLRCPACGSTRLREYGEAHGEMHYRCRNCGGSLSARL